MINKHNKQKVRRYSSTSSITLGNNLFCPPVSAFGFATLIFDGYRLFKNSGCKHRETSGGGESKGAKKMSYL
ncbi:MAG: hypothetical protein IJK87_09840 [Prevotella sp.]|nr:hypothetical protein [Prevotella sp.]